MTPLLASIAAVTVVRRRVAFVALAFAMFAVIVTRDGGWIGQTGASVLTALGCLVLGAALVRLIPGRMMITGVVLMCAVDVALLAIGVAQPSSAAVSRATSHFHGPAF